MSSTPVKPVVLRGWERLGREINDQINRDFEDEWINELYPDAFPAKSGGPGKQIRSVKDAHEDILQTIAPVIDKVLPAVELLLFLIPPWGLVADAGLALIWAFVRPSGKPEHAANVAATMLRTVENALKAQRQQALQDRAKTAADTLRDFQKWLITQRTLLGSHVTIDDYKSLEHETLDVLGRYVLPDGALTKAFTELKNTLGWFDADHEALLCVAFQSIFQAYCLRCVGYIGRATYYRCQGLYREYNRELGYIRNIIANMSSHIPELHEQLFERVQGLRAARVNSVTTQTLQFGPFPSLFVTDPESKRILGPVNKWLPSGGLETHYQDGYVDRLRAHVSHWPGTFLVFGCDIRDQLEVFLTGQKPGIPHFGPIYQRSIDMGIASPIPVGTYLSFRFDILPADAKFDDVPKSSPWSDWIQFTNPRLHPQFLIGDGFAAIETKRRIWLRCHFPGQGALPDGKEPQALVDEITGHGIMLWPEIPVHPII